MRLARAIAVGCALACGSPAAVAEPATTARLAAATFEHRVFRHILVGKIRYPAQRITWVLSRDQARAELEVFCQDGAKQPATGIQLDGAERHEAFWQAPVSVRYTGARVGELRYELTTAASPPDGSWCAAPPRALTVICRPARVAVLDGDAVLVPGKKRDDDSRTPARWKPATRHPVSGLRCELAPGEGVAAWRPAEPLKAAALIFAPADPARPGLEWADENSDMVVQTGAYRQILANP